MGGLGNVQILECSFLSVWGEGETDREREREDFYGKRREMRVI